MVIRLEKLLIFCFISLFILCFMVSCSTEKVDGSVKLTDLDDTNINTNTNTNEINQNNNLITNENNNLNNQDNNNNGVLTINSINSNNHIKIANWDLNVFLSKNWNYPDLKKEIISTINEFDIIFIQDIRDPKNQLFSELCESLSGYYCILSSKAIDNGIYNQYAVFYKKSLTVTQINDLNLNQHYIDDLKRPPIKVDFVSNNYVFSVYNFKADLNDVRSELHFLEEIVLDNSRLDSENIIILGNFYSDGEYYEEMNKDIFKEMYWVINDSIDTTVDDRNLTYNRIILNQEANEEFIKYGVEKKILGVNTNNYPVWVELIPNEISGKTGLQKDCNSIMDDSKKDLCFKEFAEDHENIGNCDYISDKIMKDLCYMEIGVKTVNTSICSLIGYQNAKDKCYKDIAISNKNLLLCDYIIDSQLKDLCVGSIGVIYEDVDICSQVKIESFRDDCLNSVAIKSGNLSICRLISNSQFMDQCFISAFNNE